MFEIKIHIEAKDLSKALTQLAIALKNEVPESTNAGAPAVVEEPLKADSSKTPQAAPEPAAIAPEPGASVQVPEPELEPKTLDLDTISRAGAALIDQGKMQDVLQLLQRYNVMAVNQLDPSQFPAFADDLRALGASI